MRQYLRAVLIGGVVIPIVLHMAASDRMPWWPDTVTLGVAFGIAAVMMVAKTTSEGGMNRRLWNALRNWKW